MSEKEEERNAENLLIMRDQAAAAGYLDNWNWQAHQRHSTPYLG